MRNILILVFILAPSVLLAEAPTASTAPPPLPTDAAAVAGRCMTCHKDSLGSWKCRKILNCDMSCSRCHKIHQPPLKGTLIKEEKELCYDCHTDTKAKDVLPSHHPVKEGKMTCSDCHDAKGEAFFESERPNETCLGCHAQYRGPYIFEHAPVIEDCTICHEPHGTVANNLLKQNEPFLCLQCHQMHFHTQKIGFNGTYVNIEGRSISICFSTGDDSFDHDALFFSFFPMLHAFPAYSPTVQ